MSRRASMLLLAALSSSEVVAAQPATTFTHIRAEDGLPSPTVWSIAQDPRGFMWFATSSGLVRYDSVEMTVYRHDPQDPRSLVHDDVSTLLVDSSGTLWVGTADGLARYVPSTDSFDRFVHDEDNASTLAGDLVTALAEDSTGAIWVGAGGLNRLNPNTGEATRYRHDAEVPESLSNDFIWAIHVDADGRLWLGTNGGGLDRFDPATERFEHIELGPADAEERNQLDGIVRALYEDSAGSLWAGTDGGLNRIDMATGEREFLEYDYDAPAGSDGILDNIVTAIYEDRAGNVWIGTGETGLSRYDPESQSFTHYQVDSSDPNSLGSDQVTCIFEDRSGLLWFGGRGLSRLDLASEQLLVHRPPPGDLASAIAAAPMSMLVDADSRVWLANMNGMARLDRAANVWSTHLFVPERPDYPDNRVYAMHDGTDGWFYVGLPQHIALYTREVDSYGPSIIPLPGTPNIIYRDREGTLWAGIPYFGLVRLPGRNGEYQEYLRPEADDATSISSDYPYFVHEDSHDRFWVGTLDGLNLLDRATGRFTRYLYNGPVDNGPSSKEFLAVAESVSGELWLGTGGGLNRFDPESGVFSHYRVSDGLAHDRVNAVAIDDTGFVWAGTDGGLSRLDPANGAIRNFFVQQGLPDNEVMALATAPDGELYIATQGGMVSLYPESFLDQAVAPPDVAITGIQISDLPVPVDKASGAGANSQFAPLSLTHRDRTLSFDLAVLDYRNPEKNRFAWMLEGIDMDWHYSRGAQRTAMYTTLPPGRYRFLYRGANASGVWAEGASAIDLTVSPAPWRTGWAYAAYALLALAGVVALVAWRTHEVTARAHTLETTVAARTRELRAQRDTIEQQSQQIREAAQTKDRLYANVSHEFRTPLTVILGPVERLLQRESAPDQRAHLETIRRNARRLLRLVEQLMDFARLDAAKIADPTPQPAGKRASLLAESFQTLAEDNELVLRIDCDPDVWVNCDADAFEKIVVNLVSNAIKYNRPGGTVDVRVIRSDDDSAELSVADTGIGIAPEHESQVFARFHRAAEIDERIPGTGLGLALVKELAAANNCVVELETQQGIGTTVRVRMPAAAAGKDTEAQRQLSDIARFEIETVRPTQLSRIEAGKTETDANARALIIEDNEDLAAYIAESLGPAYSCEIAHDGETGLRIGLETIPDVIVCDLMLPKVNGLEVIRQIKSDDRTCHVPVVMLTARADEESRLSGLRALADEYLTKPFSEAELCQRIENLLAIRELLRQRFGRQLLVESKSEDGDTLSERDRRFIARCDQVLNQHCADSEFSLAQLANAVAMSERQLQRKLKALTDNTPREYIRNFRLKKALELLLAGERIGEIAFNVGFTSQAYFTSCFKARFGAAPTLYLQQQDRGQLT